MKPGIYALGSLDGRPHDAADLVTLGLSGSAPACFACRLVDDAPVAPAAVRGAGTAFLLGEIDEPVLLAERLGLRQPWSIADLALAAFERWGEHMPAMMPGMWGFVHWNAGNSRLTAIVSEILRDPLLVATDGRRVAAAPSMEQLCALPWVGRELDPARLATIATPWIRRSWPGDPPAAANVHRVEPGTMHCLDIRRHGRTDRRHPPPVAKWQGDFEDGVEALEACARAIMRRMLARHETIAVLLSGGLDSSLVALFAAQEARPGQRVLAVSSVARRVDAIPDERLYIDAVVQALGIEAVHVTAPDSPEVYVPARDWLELRELPALTSGHFTYRALFTAARSAGATAVFGGEGGEAHFTRRERLPSLALIMTQIRRIYGLATGGHGRQAPFLFRPSKEVQCLARSTHGQVRAPAMPARGRTWQAMGYAPAFEKIGRSGTGTTEPGLRHLAPMQDPALHHLAAGFPAGFTRRAGLERAIARAILSRHLPALVANRTDKLPFSPDFTLRMRRHARAATECLGDYRRSGVGEWIDLDWLGAALAQIGRETLLDPGELREIQATANAAAFFHWWRESTVTDR